MVKKEGVKGEKTFLFVVLFFDCPFKHLSTCIFKSKALFQLLLFLSNYRGVKYT